MRNLQRARPARPQPVGDEDVVGEILEDIECLQLDEGDADDYNDLNDDTFGNGADAVWDPTETFKEAEKEATTRRVPREPRELVKCDLFDFPEPKVQPARQPRRQAQQNQSHQQQTSKRGDQAGRQSRAAAEEPVEADRRGLWNSDIASYRRLGMFEATAHYVRLVAEGTATPHKRWSLSQRTLERHARGVARTKENMEKELFLNDQAFDQILRIHLTQICKDPRLQNYTGRWNTRHLGIKSAGNNAQEEEESTTAAAEAKSALNPNRFGKTSSASVRHGRKLIQLNDIVTARVDGPVRKERQLRETIEVGYEALYMLCDIEGEIDQCPMNHVAALDKMQKEREGRLNQLFMSLTSGESMVEDLMGLNKGRKLMIKLGKKLSIETKLQLACCIIRCTPAFCRICEGVEEALSGESSLVELIQLFASGADLRPLVAFEREDEEATSGEGGRLQQRLFEASSYTQCFLFIVESLTLAGHMFLLTSETGGRQTALQRCCSVFLRSQQVDDAFSRVLRLRGGVVFMNVLLERSRRFPMAVDKGSMDLVLHYTLEVSENITSHGEEWKSLASTIMQMFQ